MRGRAREMGVRSRLEEIEERAKLVLAGAAPISSGRHYPFRTIKVQGIGQQMILCKSIVLKILYKLQSISLCKSKLDDVLVYLQ